jgi:mono/diheme cytochrome c family protein
MKTWLIRAAWALGALVALAAATLLVGTQLGERKMHRRLDIELPPFTAAASGDAAIARGRYLFMSRGCTECHGTDGAGRDVVNDGKGMHVRAPNITPGRHGVVARYSDRDWQRTVRHGIAPTGRPLIVMPSEDYARWTDGDLGALIAFMRQMPAVDGEPPTVQLPPLVKTLYAFGVVQDAAEKIDHRLPAPAPVAETVSAAHGAYVAQSCIGCHGPQLSGGKIPGAPPEWPAAANLSPGEGSALVRYRDADAFIAMMRSGKRPDGSAVSPVMPFLALKEMNDVDLRALYVHLSQLPARAAGQR